MKEQTLSPVLERFVVHWGEMGTRWGINRTMAQIHALLFLTPRPLSADEICEALQVARSNVSTSLRELQGWGIVRLVHLLGDRRDHFTTIEDPWVLFRTVLEERKRREIDPTVETLRSCLADPRADDEDPVVRDRLAAMLRFFELTDRFYRVMERLPIESAIRFFELGEKVPGKLGLGAVRHG